MPYLDRDFYLQKTENKASRKFAFYSAGFHVLIFLIVIISPLVVFKKKKAVRTKFFRVVEIQPHRTAKVRRQAKKTVQNDKVKNAEIKTAEPRPSAAAAEKKAVEKKETRTEYVMPTEIAVSNPDFQYDWYLSHIADKVERYWQPPRGIPGDGNLAAVVFFRILKNGQISDIELEKSTRNETLDRLALRSVKRAAPFPKLPPRFLQGVLEVTFTLNYIR